MLNINNLKCKLNTSKNKCGPIKSLYEVEYFLRKICQIKKSANFAKQAKCLFKGKN